jgi:hypothetical protein
MPEPMFKACPSIPGAKSPSHQQTPLKSLWEVGIHLDVKSPLLRCAFNDPDDSGTKCGDIGNAHRRMHLTRSDTVRAGFNSRALSVRGAQFRQLLRIALPAHDGIHYGQPCQPGNVVDHVMDLYIHLRQRLVYVLDMLAGHLHRIAAMPHQRPHCADIAIRSKCGTQQSYRMQKL